MGLVLQTQRRALEAFDPYAMPAWPREALERNDARFIAGQADTDRFVDPLVCIGISQGIGTCSDLHGVSIAVLEYAFEIKKSQEDFPVDWAWLGACKFAVLQWPSGVCMLPTPAQPKVGLLQVDPQVVNPMQIHRTLELLEFFSFKQLDFGATRFTNIYLGRTGLLSSYIPI